MVEILTKITAILTTVVITIAGWLGFQQPVQAPLGATIPKVVAVFETSLASKITSSATSMTLVSGTDKAGNPLSGYMCFVLDEGTASEEFVCGTASSTSVTGMIRGIDPVDGDLEVASLKKEHRRGASVKVTNYPQLAILSRILNGDETLPNALEYATSVSTSTLAGNNQYLASVGYVNNVSYAGTSDADEDTKGIVEQATRSELGSGVSSGDTSAPLFVPNQYFSTSSSATTSVVVTKSNGKINQNFWDLTEDFTWSGEHTFSATATFSGMTTFNGAVDFSTNIPTIPTSTPTADNEVVSKNFVDVIDSVFQIAAISTGADISASTTETINSESKTLMKEIQVFHFGRVKLSYETQDYSGGAIVECDIRINGHPYYRPNGTQATSTNTGGWTQYTEDIWGLYPQDRIQLYCSDQGGDGQVRNFNLYYTLKSGSSSTTAASITNN